MYKYELRVSTSQMHATYAHVNDCHVDRAGKRVDLPARTRYYGRPCMDLPKTLPSTIFVKVCVFAVTYVECAGHQFSSAKTSAVR